VWFGFNDQKFPALLVLRPATAIDYRRYKKPATFAEGFVADKLPNLHNFEEELKGRHQFLTTQAPPNSL